ncbi:MAG: hypothetical protein Aureis2KO_23440 [Aureisphaera sp.]
MIKSTLQIVSLSFLILFSLSCSSDDNNNSNTNQQQQEEETPTNLLLGSWSPNRFIIICDSGAFTEYSTEECTQNSRFIFTLGDDPSNVNEGNFRDIPYRLDSENNCIEEIETNGTWELNGDELTINFSGNSNTSSISELTETSFRINNNPNPYTSSPCTDSDPGLEYLVMVKVE